MFRSVVLGCIVLTATPWPMAAPAAEIEKVRFADEVTIEGQRLPLNNVGLMYYRGIFKALVAGIYFEPRGRAHDVLADVPKRLEVVYLWDVQAKDITAATEKLLANNLTPEEIKSLRKEFDYVYTLYPNIKAGDRFQLTYVPGVGTEFALNGKPRGLVLGEKFAAAYFSIWIGKKPMDKSLRDQLLARR